MEGSVILGDLCFLAAVVLGSKSIFFYLVLVLCGFFCLVGCGLVLVFVLYSYF